MPPPFLPPIARLRVLPDDPAAVVAPRPRGSYRPHTDATVAAVRRLIEQTTLTYREIAAKTGVARRSFGRWARDGGWQRPPFAPRATDTVPTVRAGRKLKLRLLAARLAALAERYVRELEETPGVDLDKLGEALELMKMAKLAARPRKPRPSSPFVPVHTGTQGPKTLDEPTRPIMQLCAADVSLQAAPREAVEDFLASRAPPSAKPAPRRRRRRSTRNAHHAWMLEREWP
jgi:hypothetical protein